MQRTDYAICGWIVGTVVACSSTPIDIGDDNAQSTAPAWTQGLGGTYSTDPIRPPPVDSSLLQAGTVPPGCQQRQEPFNPTISYRGYIQNFLGSSDWPSDVVILKFAELTTSAVSGRVLSDQAGAGNFAALGSTPANSCWPTMQGAEGFQYTMLEASFDGQRLRFTVNRNEPMCAWCGQQTPYDWGYGDFSCSPNSQGQSVPGGIAVLPVGTSEWQLWDCLAYIACQPIGPHYCACSADGCGAGTMVSTGPDGVAFDLVMNGDQLTGPAGSLGNAVLTREAS
jgi:hypothetical protein